jgi:hypothetical protein
MAKETPVETDWEYDVAYKLVDLYVKELTERRDKKMLNIEGLVEAYLYVLGRLKASEHEMGQIVKAVKDELRRKPEVAEASGIKEALGDKKINAGLLKALENM